MTRDPKRIPEVLKKLQKVWRKYPELRLCQLIVALTKKSDPYYVEDDWLLTRLEQILKEGLLV